MAVEVVFSPEADADVAEATDYYEQIRPGLADAFLARLRECVQKIATAPAARAVIRTKYRKSLLKKFTYAVYNEYDGTQVIIQCVYHTSRDPAGLDDRLP